MEPDQPDGLELNCWIVYVNIKINDSFDPLPNCSPQCTSARGAARDPGLKVHPLHTCGIMKINTKLNNQNQFGRGGCLIFMAWSPLNRSILPLDIFLLLLVGWFSLVVLRGSLLDKPEI